MSKKQSRQLFLFLLFFTVGITVATALNSFETVRNILIIVLAAYSLIIDKPVNRKKLQSADR